jgi:SAM-dependent methyltransferase
VFAERADGCFALTPLAACLRTGVPDSQRAKIMASVEQGYQAWGNLLHTVKTGGPAFEHVFGMAHYDYLGQNPEAASLFQEWMDQDATEWVPSVVAAYDFSTLGTLVDVGGGHGTLLAAILQAHPSLRGILFDQPSVVTGAQRILAATGVVERCAVMGGDFFGAVPAGGDLYLLSRVLFNWADDRAVAILQNCRRAMGGSGKLLVVEPMMPADHVPVSLALNDLHFMVMNRGRVRTEAEFRVLFDAAGLRLVRIIPTQAGVSMIEGGCP